MPIEVPPPIVRKKRRFELFDGHAAPLGLSGSGASLPATVLCLDRTSMVVTNLLRLSRRCRPTVVDESCAYVHQGLLTPCSQSGLSR